MVSPNPNDPQPLKYTMLGEDNSTTEEKLANYAGTVDWTYLRPHYQSGVLYFVDTVLKLAEVGCAFTENHKDRVEAWLKAGDIVKIVALHAEQWEKEGDKTEFEALVVSPFVLCRPV
ncbi:MAG: DUF2288 family protein [Verrucomicrobia bacterium]|jgi:hypothetical protein|nr:DUF2288 family protein [Verrucomicrobiota bacterium]|tara:strand:+ start:30 stop:380 length:351 start_codon:yes stop_codon:yes gene_type:complete